MSEIDGRRLEESPFSDFLGFELLLEEQDRELLGRVDPSIATFVGVHGGLAMGSIGLCGSSAT